VTYACNIGQVTPKSGASDKNIFLTAFVVYGATFLADHFRGELQIAGPIDSLIRGQPEQEFEWPPKLNEPYPDLHLVGNR